MDRRVRTTG